MFIWTKELACVISCRVVCPRFDGAKSELSKRKWQMERIQEAAVYSDGPS